MLHFLHFERLNFVILHFHLLGMHLSARWKDKRSKKILYDKYVLILTIRYGHVDNHFTNKFILICQIGYFMNDDENLAEFDRIGI